MIETDTCPIKRMHELREGGVEIVDSCHLVSFYQQAIDKGGTDESGSAGDEGAHYQLSPVRR